MERKAQEAQLKLELEERKADDRKETDEDRHVYFDFHGIFFL